MMMLSSFSSGKRLILGSVFLVLVVIGGGVWLATKLSPTTYESDATSSEQELLISNINIGSLVSPDEATRKDPRFTIKHSYSSNEKLVVQVETTHAAVTPLQLSFRLITPQGTFIDLSPSTLTFQPGKSIFCCWDAPPKGEYRLQVFRPEKTVTSIPLIINR